ncbi:V-type ATP synthase subunit I, partial [Halobacteriales archaeon QH_2_65_14]
MLRPEQMSKVSVTGANSVMDDVIETMHDLHLVHITDYDGSWTGFEPGDSLEGADETSSQLVTVRAIESILDVSEDDAGSTASVDLSNADERLEEVRREVNDLDDRRDDLRDRQRDIEERLDQMELFADLGIDLELLWGYDSLSTLVGEGSPAEIEAALGESDGIDAFEVFSGSDSVAVFARETGAGALDDAMVGVPFTAVDVPEKSGAPQSNVEELEHELQQVETKLERVESELESLKLEHAGFLLALEEELSIDAEKYEAPLRFATTERSFIVEGWVPAGKYEAFESTLQETLGDRVEIAELERAAYTRGSHLAPDEGHDTESQAATDGGTVTDGDAADAADERVATDGGHSEGVVTVEDDPPVIQRNPDVMGPFELLVKAVNRPKYSEFDPTITLFLTFPLFFGFMIGDVGYGVLYVLLGYWVSRKFDSQGLVDFGKIVAWLGVFTVVFGFLYGEVFGLHFLEWFDIHPVLEKGITDEEWAITWLIVAVLAGWVHLNIGSLFYFVEELQLHGTSAAVVEVGSWLLMLNGLWVFIFSDFLSGSKPGFLVGEEALLNHGPLGFGFTGFPEIAGILGLAAFGLGILLLLSGPWYETFEFLVPLAHTLSYTRLTAVLLAKAGMAFVVNLLFFGVYIVETSKGEEWHFGVSGMPA